MIFKNIKQKIIISFILIIIASTFLDAIELLEISDKLNNIGRIEEELSHILISIFLSIPIIIGLVNHLVGPINRIQKIIDENLDSGVFENSSELEKLEKSFTHLLNLNKKYTRDILENERRITSMLDSIDVGIVEIDGDTHRIVNINQYGCDLLGVTKDSVIGQLFCYQLICTHENSDTCSLKNYEDYESFRKECSAFNHVTNKHLQVLKNVVKIPVNSHSNIIESFIDITERKVREEELAVAKSIAAAADEGKTNLLKKVCHDIGNRMSEGVGIANIILKMPNLPTECIIKLNEIIDSLKVMDNSLQLMRDKTMLITGQSKIRIDSIDLIEFIRIHASSVRVGIESKGIKFNLILSDDLTNEDKCFISTDAAKLDAIIVNLIGNASKFTKEGSVTWRVETTEKNSEKMKVKFSIIDSGIGIAEHEQEKVFEAYEQANEDIIKEFGGSGQGLAIVRNYVRMLGGEIKLFSKVGKGSIFSFELEFKLPESKPITKTDDVTQEELNSLYILAADDSHIMREIMNDIFIDLKVNYKIASSGEEVIEIMNHEYFDFVFLDIQMGVISGVETAKKLRENFNNPIIALTANYSDLDIDEYQSQGINDCIGKPYDASKIKSVIIKYKDRHVLNVEKVKEQYKDSLYVKLFYSFKKEFKENYQYLQDFLDIPEIDGFEIEDIDEQMLNFKRHAHTIKGIAASLHTDSIRHICYLLEKKAERKELKRNEDKEQCRKLLELLQKSYEHFTIHFKENFEPEEKQ